MYQLEVFYAGDDFPRFTRRIDSAAEVLEVIGALFDEHPGCEQVAVTMGATRLFSIDCDGVRRP